MSFVNSIKKDGENIILHKCREPVPELLISVENIVSIAFLDSETTGLDKLNDQVIELAVKVVKVEENSGKIISIDHEYESFNDPNQELDDKITLLTGINNEMVKGQSIDWSIVDDILKDMDFVVSHNARFDRPFVDRDSEVSPNLVWACSMNDISWMERGFSNTKQELLCYWHGFYFDAHRAMNDIDALIHLLTHSHYNGDRPIVELIENSKKQFYIIKVTNFPFDEIKKNTIKTNGYSWNPVEKVWYKTVLLTDVESEKEWLTEVVYESYFKGLVEEINIIDKYKS